MGALEITANLVATFSVLLAGRNSVHTWWTGIISSMLFAVLFYQNKLFADVTLQVFFILTSAIGWWQWILGNQGSALPISHTNFKKMAWTVPVGVTATTIYGGLLHYFTSAYAPFLDSAILVFSVIAQLLLMQRRIENWGFWIIVNTIAVPLYASRALYFTALLYSGYWVNAAISWWQWRRLVNQSVK